MSFRMCQKKDSEENCEENAVVTDSELVDAASVRKLGEEIDRPSDVILGGALSNRYNEELHFFNCQQ